MSTINAYVHAITHAGAEMLAYDLRPVDEASELPPFEAGAHIDVHIKPGVIRQYSLCNDPTERHRYLICVHREAAGRGGSRALHDTARVGWATAVGAPRNHFPLLDGGRYVLIAGGIGVTPLIAMAQALRARGKAYELHVYARDRSRIPLREQLLADAGDHSVTIHLSAQGDTLRAGPPAGIGEYESGTLLYTCGPSGFMEAVAEYADAAGYPAEAVHRERFAPSATAPAGDPAADGSFEVVLASTGGRVTVPGDTSIAEALAQHGIDVDLSCEQGMCGACLTPVISGIPDHRDDVQSAHEHEANTHITVCCSRSKTPELVLDL